MTAVPVSPIVLQNVLFQVDADDFAAHVSKVQFDPTTTTTTWKGLSPAGAFSGSGRATWTCSVDLAQDWKTPGSLARYLFAHEGETKTVVFQPEAGDGEPSWTVDVTIVPGAIGGSVDTVPVSTVTLQCAARPVPDWDNDPLTPNPVE